MILYTVIPCFNEEKMLPKTIEVMFKKYRTLMGNYKISEESKILFVDDGSSDETWNIIEKAHKDNPIFCGIKLSRNRGHQNALFAGLITAAEYCDAAISIDADLQDDISAIDKMIEKFSDGAEVVYGIRNKRKSDSFMKRFTAEGYYKVMRFFGADIIYNHADFRLMSKRAIESLGKFDEVNLFLRGMVPLVGFKSDKVYYERLERTAGESKYTVKKMLDLAWNGITSFSTRPIEMILGAGIGISMLSVLAIFIMFIAFLFGAQIAPAWWIVAVIFLCCGINLGAIGIVGEYVAKAYLETKHRPKFFIEKEIF